MVWKLFHVEEDILKATDEAEAKREELVGKKVLLEKHDEETKALKKKQAKLQKDQLLFEKEFKKLAKDLESKVNRK